MPKLRFVKNSLLCLCLAAPGAAWAQAAVAWLAPAGQVEVRALGQGPAPVATGSSRVPLGSLWKVFVYAWLVDTQAKESAYACSASKIDKEDRYCCDPGGQVERNLALARSCAPYFAPQRLGLNAAVWQQYQAQISRQQSYPQQNVNPANQRIAAPAWLLDIRQLQPATEVPLQELLQALANLSPNAKAAARSALLETAVAVYGREAWTRLGSGLRYKTYSWHRNGLAFGGAAGWLVDGTPFWFGGPGSSRFALPNWADQISAALPPARWSELDTAPGAAGESASCVDVEFFARYPLRSVHKIDAANGSKPASARPAAAGNLQGRYELQFVNGKRLEIQGDGSLKLSYQPAPRISARLGLNQYVARVVEREGDASATQAARALAIAARSYLLQNGQFAGGCWQLADSSQTQRVSPNPPSAAALSAAWFTDEMILQGVPVHYHTSQEGPNRMAWRSAANQAGQGWDFEKILLYSFPQATLGSFSGHSECVRLPQAETWLAQATPGWQRQLGREAGFEALPDAPRVCTLAQGQPYSDQRRLRIYVRGWQSLDQRITLAHEYLHLAFRFHPRGADENYIERLARRLIEG